MEWLVIFALGFWLYAQSKQLGELRGDVDGLKLRLSAALQHEVQSFQPAEVVEKTEPSLSPDPSVLIPDVPQTQFSPPSPTQFGDGDDSASPSQPKEMDEVVAAAINQHRWLGRETTANSMSDEPSSGHPAGKGPTSSPWLTRKPDRKLESWLAENGLAWLGGGALALGGVFLIAYASQRGLFTPAMRLFAALIVGFIMIAASEWTRRTSSKEQLNHPLVAALLAGAGVGTLYATAWGAHGLYHYIDWGTAAVALVACAVLLLALSFLHGGALGLLAIAAAFLTPLLTSTGDWPSNALLLFLVAVGAAGYGIAALRRLGWTAAVTALGLYAWFAIFLAGPDVWGALALLCSAAIGGAAVALRSGDSTLEQPANARLWVQARAFFPSVVIVVSSILMLTVWVRLGGEAVGAPVAGVCLAGALLIALAVVAMRAGLTQPPAVAIALIMPALGALSYWWVRDQQSATAPGVPQFFAWMVLSSGVVLLAGIASIGRSALNERSINGAASAFSSLVLLLVGALWQRDIAEFFTWGLLFSGTLIFLLAAHLSARSAQEPMTDWAVDSWTVAALVSLIVGIEFAFDRSVQPLALAAAGAAAAGLYRWRGWRSAAHCVVLLSVLCLAHAIAPSFSGIVANTSSALASTLLVLAGSAAALFGASLLLRARAAVSHAADSASTAAILLVLFAMFLALRWIAAGGVGAPIDEFTENSLRVLVVMAAGAVSFPRPGVPAGLITRIRSHVLLSTGLFVALLYHGLWANPWWGTDPAFASGPPLLNTLALAFAAPAGLAFIGARRIFSREPMVGRTYALAGGTLAATWAILEIRRGFHHATMSVGPIGLLEGTAYGLLALLCGLVVATRARVRRQVDLGAAQPLGQGLGDASSIVVICAVIVSVFFLGLVRNPWWGVPGVAETGSLVHPIAIAAQAIAGALCLLLARMALDTNTRLCAVLGSAFYGVSLGVLTARYLHHFELMAVWRPLIGLEGFAYALWPLMFLTAAAYGLSRLKPNAAGSAFVEEAGRIIRALLWPALVWLAIALSWIFNPWWGPLPALVNGWTGALLGLGAYLFAAALSLVTADLQLVRESHQFRKSAKMATVIHLFVAATLIVRWAYRGENMLPAPIEASLETWTYSAVWALFGAALIGLGTVRRDSILRWAGLVLLLATTAKVFLIDMQRLDGVIRATSFLGVGGVLIVVALSTRRFGRGARKEDSVGDLPSS